MHILRFYSAGRIVLKWIVEMNNENGSSTICAKKSLSVIWSYGENDPGESAPQSKNAVCALLIDCKLLPFPLEKSSRNEQTINSFS